MSEIHYERPIVREMLEEKLRASIQRVSFGTIRSVDDLSLWLDRGFASACQRKPMGAKSRSAQQTCRNCANIFRI